MFNMFYYTSNETYNRKRLEKEIIWMVAKIKHVTHCPLCDYYQAYVYCKSSPGKHAFL